MREYTNIRAYLNLGYAVEYIYLRRNGQPELSQEIKQLFPITWSEVSLAPRAPSFLDRLSYRLGWPIDSLLNQLYPYRAVVQAAVYEREQRTPNSIHQLEYMDIASAAVGLNGRFIWGSIDLEPERYLKIQTLRYAHQNYRRPAIIQQKYRRLRQAERRIAAACRLVLTIAANETVILNERLGDVPVRLLPMSWPQEEVVVRTRPWLEGGVLRMLHLGSMNSMVPYLSLRFLLTEVFPLISPEVLARIELLVAGDSTDGEYSREIKKLAGIYQQVKILGFVDNLESLLSQTDVQVVGSHVATGLRTRIVESFARGLPVLSTIVAADGVAGLEPGRNILLAEDAAAFAQTLVKLVETPFILESLAEAAHQTYLQIYSQAAAAQCLAGLLNQYL